MADDNDTLADALVEKTQEPRTASRDGFTASDHSIPDQIAGLRFARTLTSQSKGNGFRVQKLRMGGAVSGQ